MFYKIIERKRDEWLGSQDCVVSDLVSYIERQHMMRDAQIDAIKTFLYLKIECKNRPLWELVASGKFNSMDVDSLEVNRATREVLQSKWMEQSNFNSVLGFSGTPNMDPAAHVHISDGLTVKCTQYSNVVTYYPLIDGIGNFLKIPKVRYANFDSSEIINNGLKEFFEEYADTRPLRMKIRNICGDETIVQTGNGD